jgi:hypothetical protein
MTFAYWMLIAAAMRSHIRFWQAPVCGAARRLLLVDGTARRCSLSVKPDREFRLWDGVRKLGLWSAQNRASPQRLALAAGNQAELRR